MSLFNVENRPDRSVFHFSTLRIDPIGPCAIFLNVENRPDRSVCHFSTLRIDPTTILKLNVDKKRSLKPDQSLNFDPQ